jgi:hypothetical protein
MKLKEAFYLLSNYSLDKLEKDKLLSKLKEKTIPKVYESPV